MLSEELKNKFIQINDSRIRLTNVKNYGIATSSPHFFEDIFVPSSHIETISKTKKSLFTRKTKVVHRERTIDDGLVPSGKTIQITEERYNAVQCGNCLRIVYNDGHLFMSRRDPFMESFPDDRESGDAAFGHFIFGTRDRCLKQVFVDTPEMSIKVTSFCSFSSLSQNRSQPSDARAVRFRYLYVTTYQNDNFTYYEDEVLFSIDEKLKELDSLLKL